MCPLGGNQDHLYMLHTLVFLSAERWMVLLGCSLQLHVVELLKLK